MVVAQNPGAVQNINRELLSQCVRLIAHENPDAKSAHLSVFGDSPGTRNRLGQSTNRKSDRVFRKSEVMTHLGRASRLGDELRSEDVEVLDTPHISLNQRAKTGLASGPVLAETRNLTKL